MALQIAHTTRDLSDRERTILIDIIEHYIERGEPIGSRTLSKHISMALSPATIRNVMSDLKDKDYLSQPHTSSGRVPTDKGLRFYVDTILKQKQTRVYKMLHSVELGRDIIKQDLSDVLNRVSGLLAELSGEAGLVLTPQISKMRLKSLGLVKLAEKKIIVIFVSESGFVQDKIVFIEEDVSKSELTKISNYINHHFEGKSIPQIMATLRHLIEEDRVAYDKLYRHVVAISTKCFGYEAHQGDEENLYITGTNQIVDKLDALDFKQVKSLLEGFETKTRLLKVLQSFISACNKDDLVVSIGRENHEDFLTRCSIVSAPYSYNGDNYGIVGVIGPKRMDYSYAISVVSHIARQLSKLLEELTV